MTREEALARTEESDFLYYHSEWLNDTEVVLSHLIKNPMASAYIKYKPIVNNKDYILQYIDICPTSAIDCASNELKKDKEVIEKAISRSESTFQYFLCETKSDEEFVLSVIDQIDFDYVDSRIKKNKDFIKRIVKAGKFTRNIYFYMDKNMLKGDIEFLKEILEFYGGALECFPDYMRNDKELVLKAVRNRGGALQYASDRLKKDKEVVLAAIKQNKYACNYSLLEGYKILMKS